MGRMQTRQAEGLSGAPDTRERLLCLVWLGQRTRRVPAHTLPPLPMCPSLTQVLVENAPASHPAVRPVQECGGGGGLDTDWMDVLGVGDRRGQLQQGNAIGLPFGFRVYEDVLHLVPVEVGA